MRALLEAAVGQVEHVADVHEVDAPHGAVLAHHRRHVVAGGAAEAAGAQRQAVGRAVDEPQQSVQVALARHDARQAEDRVGRIVRMNRHLHAARLGHRHDGLQEIREVAPESLLTHLRIGLEQRAQLALFIAGVPAGQGEAILEGIQPAQLIHVHDQARRAIRARPVQLRARPVEDRHEVVAHALDAVLCHTPDVLLIGRDVSVTRGPAQLDILVHGDALHHVEHQARLRALVLQALEALLGPDLARAHVIHGADDAAHARDLADLPELDRVVRAIPAE